MTRDIAPNLNYESKMVVECCVVVGWNSVAVILTVDRI